jgi:tetratricopeptide (TPR) repeat protein
VSERVPNEDPSKNKAIPGFDETPAGQADEDPNRATPIPGLDDEPPVVAGAVVEEPAAEEAKGVADEAQAVEVAPPEGAETAAEPEAEPEAAGPAAEQGPAKPQALPLPFAPPVEQEARTISAADAAGWNKRIEALVSEARARAGEPSSVTLWFEAGRIYESELGNLKMAIGHYQEAHKVDPTYVPVIHAARRVFALVKQWRAVVMLLGTEIKIEGADKPALLTEMARVHEAKLNQRAEAARLYREALEVDPAYGPAVEGLRRFLDDEKDYRALAQLLMDAAEACDRPAEAISWLVAAGRVFESRLEDDESAKAAFERAREAGPGRADVLHALRRLYARRGESALLAAVLDEIATGSDPLEAVRFLQERAQILLGAGDEPAAIEALLEARRRHPHDTLVLRELGQLLEKRGEWAELEAVLDAQASATRDVHERVALHAEAGRLCELHLRAPERAISHYHSCVELDPSFQPALRALGKLYARQSRWSELAEVYSVELGSADERQRVGVLFRQAELLADEVGDLDRAIENLTTILKMDPGYLPANKLLATLYIKGERWSDLVEMYESELAATEDKEQAIFLLEKIGRLHEHQLQSPDAAVECYRRMLAWHPGYLPALRALGRLYAKAGRWDDLIAINEEEAEVVGDMAQVVSLLVKNGEILAEKLERVEDAIDTLRRALAMMPNYLPALRALGRLYAKGQRWEDLVNMHRDEIDVARTPAQRAALYSNIAELYEKQIGDVEKAAEAWRELLDEVPNYHPAIRALARYAQAAGDNEKLVELLHIEISLLEEPHGRGLLRCRIADLLDRALGKPAEAVAELEGAIAEVPSLLEAHERLVSLQTRRGLDREEAESRERMHGCLPDVTSRVANLRALGHVYLHRLDDPNRAVATFDRLLEERPEDRGARAASLSCALRMRDYGRAIVHAEALADLVGSAKQAAELHLSVANWKASHLDPPEDPLRSYLRALEYEPLHPLALRQVEGIYLERGEYRGLHELYERERGAVTAKRRKADLSVKMGDILDRFLSDPELAIACYEQALKDVPEFLPAIARLQGVYERLSRPQDKIRLLALEARASKDEQNAIKTLLEVAGLHRDQFNDVDAAIETFFAVLERDPENLEAYKQTQELLTKNERWRMLAELYWRRADAVEDPTSKVEYLTRAASIAEEKLEDPKTAMSVYERVVKAAPEHATALLRLGELQYTAGEFELAQGFLERVLSATADPALAAPAHYRLGVIFDERLPDPARAVDHLGKALQANLGHRKARIRMAGALVRVEAFDRAIEAYKQLVASAETADEARIFRISLANIYETHSKDFEKAAAQYDAAIASADDPAVRMDLAERAAGLYERSGDLDGYLNMAKRQAEALTTTAPAEAARLLARCAKLMYEKKGDGPGAQQLAQKSVELAPENLEVRGFYADLLSVQPNQLTTAVEQHRRILSGKLRAESLRMLCQGWTKARARDRAFVASELLCFLGVATESEQQLYADNKKHVSEGSEISLDPGQITSWVLHPAQRSPVHDVLSLVGTELTKVDPDDLENYAIEKKDILKARSNDRLRALSEELVRVVGAFNFEARRTRVRPHACEAHHGNPVCLVVGHEIERSYRPREQRFLLGSRVFLLRTGQHLVAGKPVDDLRTLLTAVGRSVDRSFPSFLEGADVDAMTKKVGSSLSRGLKKQLQEPVAALASQRMTIDLQGFLDAVPLSAARGGMMLSNEFAVAARMVRRRAGKQLPANSDELIAAVEGDPALMDLVHFAVSDGYFNVRQRLNVAIDA